jgi:NAD(P)-dependent dehydrogenase (short-subunit alcohol dehydrogenase family)
MDFEGKVALVTGGGNGIGRAVCLGFAKGGAKVVVVDKDAAAAARTADTIKQLGGAAISVAADVTKSADVKAYVRKTIDTYGRIDCFFNNAGIEGKVAPTHEYDEDMFDAVLNVNVKGVFLGLKYVLQEMVKQRSGAVVNTASVAGLMASPGMSAYVASKHAVLGLTKTAGGEVARTGVRVNAVCPGPVETRMIADLAKQLNPSNPDQVGVNYRASIPSGKYSTPEDIANMVLFLCSDLSTHITGAHFVVDGGRTATPGAVTEVGKK